MLRKQIPVARRVLEESDDLTLILRSMYARVLCGHVGGTRPTGPTVDDLREAVTTLEDTHRIARRVLGAAHPICAEMIGPELQLARGFLCARERERESSQPG